MISNTEKKNTTLLTLFTVQSIFTALVGIPSEQGKVVFIWIVHTCDGAQMYDKCRNSLVIL